MATNALTLLTSDREAIQRLFRSYQSLVDDGAADAEKAALAEQICRALRTHIQLKEELLYPAARRAMQLDEAATDHSAVRELMEQIERMTADDAFYDARLALLGECLDQSGQVEETELFPKVEEVVDVQALEAPLRQRKEELLAARSRPTL